MNACIWRLPQPKKLDTPRQKSAYLFAWSYAHYGRKYHRAAPCHLCVQHQRRNYLAAVEADQMRGAA